MKQNKGFEINHHIVQEKHIKIIGVGVDQKNLLFPVCLAPGISWTIVLRSTEAATHPSHKNYKERIKAKSKSLVVLL